LNPENFREQHIATQRLREGTLLAHRPERAWRSEIDKSAE
jgi:hypothetical protein